VRHPHPAAGPPRASHKRYYGLILPVEHDIWKVIFPPNGYGCKCSVSALPRRQAEREGISGEPDVDMVEFTNPRTGQTVLIPDDITPSFAHNHGDRLGAMDALFGERNGEEALAAMIAEREAWLDKRYSVPSDKVAVLALSDKVSEKEVKRLAAKASGGNNISVYEAEAAAAWQQATGDRLEVFDLGETDGRKPADYLISDPNLPKEKWLRLDFMYVTEPFKLEKMNHYFQKTDEIWSGQMKTIQEHLQKADIVPLDFSALNLTNRHRVLQYVLSLPEVQRNKIRILVKESK